MNRQVPEALADLIEFLRDCPGRLSAAIVADAGAGETLTRRIESEFEVARLAGRPRVTVERLQDAVRIGARAAEMAGDDHWLLLVADGREEFASGEQRRRFWQRLNHLRETLASGRLRTCFVVTPENERLLALHADDLWDWVRVFRFVGEAEPPPPKEGEISAFLPLPPVFIGMTGESSSSDLARMREQLERANRAGLPGPVVARDYALPLLLALAQSGEREEALALWEGALRRGSTLDRSLREEAERLLRATATTTVGWLQLSDLQFRVEESRERTEMRAALLDDLAMFAGRSEPQRGARRVRLHFIAITGDIAYSGDAREYERAEEFLLRLCEVTKVPRERVFPVPGNHDIDRSRDAPAFVRRALRGRREYEQLWHDDTWRASLVGAKLAAYREFVRRINPTLALADDQPGGFLAKFEIDGKRIAVLGASTCWLGDGSRDDEGALVTGVEQVHELAGGRSLPDLAGSDLKIALLHHPLGWMQEFDRREMAVLLAGHFDLLLYAHSHRSEVEVERWARRGRMMSLVSNAGGREGGWTGFNIVRVDVDKSRAQIWPRAYDMKNRRFDVDLEFAPSAAEEPYGWGLGPVSSDGREPSVRPSTDRIARAYLARLMEENRFLDIRGMGAKAAERMELREVYTRLRVTEPAGEEQDVLPEHPDQPSVGEHEWERPRDVELRDVLAKHQHLVLVGDPGSGKTTFLRFVALNLARALLEPGARDESMRSIGLMGEPPFPVFVRLGAIGEFLRKQPDEGHEPDAPEHLYRYLDFTWASTHPDASVDFLRRRVAMGGCMLLLDGLDEVSGEALRERVGRIVERVVADGKRSGNRHVVTSRTRAYQGRAQLAADFTRCALVDFGDDEVEEFVTHWSRALHRVAPGDEESSVAEAYRAELLEAIRAHPNVALMTTNPLLLTVLAVVHWSRKKLPEQRAELYDAAVDFLVESREKLSDFPAPLRKECLQAIALRMFEDPKGVRKTLERADVAAVVQPLLGVEFDRALEFVEDEELHSGVLVSRTEGEVEFWHLTFQEYLAALGLALRPDYFTRVALHLYDDRWNEVVLLLAGCRRRQGTAFASDLVTRILASEPELPGRARAVGLIGRILRDIAPYGGDPAAGTGYDAALRETLAVFEPSTKPLPETVRVEVGEALGQAGDPRRLDEMVTIEGGSFWMGAQKERRDQPSFDVQARSNEAPVRRVTVSTFRISRYPITVELFWKFVEAGTSGYLDPRFWDPIGWTWREKNRDRRTPDNWAVQLRHSNRPVIGVSWFEADAYARWRGMSLPTEAQWELAAKGRAGRPFPWGEAEPTQHHANFGNRVGGPSPVGIHPLGATPTGVHDLAGNVWEWCADWYGIYPKYAETNPTGSRDGIRRVLRGGSFFDVRSFLRCTYRDLSPPEDPYHFIGFRCVQSTSGG